MSCSVTALQSFELERCSLFHVKVNVLYKANQWTMPCTFNKHFSLYQLYIVQFSSTVFVAHVRSDDFDIFFSCLALIGHNTDI